MVTSATGLGSPAHLCGTTRWALTPAMSNLEVSGFLWGQGRDKAEKELWFVDQGWKHDWCECFWPSLFNGFDGLPYLFIYSSTFFSTCWSNFLNLHLSPCGKIAGKTWSVSWRQANSTVRPIAAERLSMQFAAPKMNPGKLPSKTPSCFVS